MAHHSCYRSYFRQTLPHALHHANADQNSLQLGWRASREAANLNKLLLTDDINNDTMQLMPDPIAKIGQQMQESPGNISFSNLCKVCDHYFGKPRQDSSSHRIYKTPWAGDPRINIQNDKGKAKAYR